MLNVSDVFSGYGKLQILNGVTITAKPSETTVIVGPNGSGKSTLLKTIAGYTSVYGGHVEVDGQNITGLASHKIAKKGIAYLPQNNNVFTNLTVNENLRLAGYSIETESYKTRLKRVIELFPQLSPYTKSKASNLSGGERQMLAMAIALIRDPDVMLFDEPTANLAPIIATQVLNLISSLAKDTGLTILLAEQNAKRALEIGDTAYLLVGGKVAFSGTTHELLEHKELGKLYLGLLSS
ncbi:MAG TPA: ABC transporter ATP-binding protein [Terriglobales bacterium]|nr:ABC transporter ATP-binding protein [Terriglobales bacterium]